MIEGLSDESRAVLSIIRHADEAWSQSTPIEAVYPGVLGSLVAAGLVETWRRPDYDAVTLTPLAASLLGLMIVERWRYAVVDLGRNQVPPSRHVARVADEVPTWSDMRMDARGVICGPPVRLPRHADEVPLPSPERLADRREAESAIDHTTGMPMHLLGVPVASNRRHGWSDAARLKLTC